MNMCINEYIHDVSKIVVKKVRKLSTGYCRDIIIYTENGRKEITLFSKNPEALEF